MGALIDASVLIAVERGHLEPESYLTTRPEMDFALAAITASELLHGVHRASTELLKARREAYVETLLSSIPVIDFDLIAARVHARLSARLASRGTMVGAHDLLIAATALSRGMEVVARDARSFPRIPGLSLVRI